MNAKTVLKSSPFNTTLTKTIKSSKTRFHCQTDPEGSVYVTTGYFLVKLSAAEYNAIVRPVSQRDAGNWVLSETGELMDMQPIDMVACMNDALKTAAHSVTAAPFLFDLQRKDKVQLVCYYSEDGNFVAGFNSNYNAIVSPTLERRSGGPVSPMVVYAADNDPIAMLLPVKIDDKPQITRTIRAWFGAADEGQPKTDKAAEKLRRCADEMEAAAKQKEEENIQLRRENESLRQQYAKDHIDRDELLGQIEELQTAIAVRNEQINSLLEQVNAQPIPQVQETPAGEQPQDKAAALVEKLAALPNVTAIIKGVRTAAPVVWLSGDTDTHKADIEKLGGKWSGKRSAWYFKIA